MCSLVQKTPYSSKNISIKPFFLGRTLKEDLVNDIIDFMYFLGGCDLDFSRPFSLDM